MKRIIKNIALCGLVAGGGLLASCEDFLTITPSSSIVEEEFWQDKNDLNNAVYACYKRLVSNDMLNTYINWGESRSDNFDISSSISKTSQIANIMNANLLPTYGQFNWESMYNAINYCNKVLVHGPEVVENDESFSESDWAPVKAEAIALRAFCHFWLVRTYGEIPYVTVDYNNDSQELRLPQSTQLEVLDNIISDLESIKNSAMNDYGNTVLNKGRFTKKSVHALLADVYLWRASYKTGNCHPFTKLIFSKRYAGELTDRTVRQETYSTSAQDDYMKCVENCDAVINMIKDETLENINKKGLNIGGQDIELTLEDLLIQNLSAAETGAAVAKPYITTKDAYRNVFGTGNSSESILEFQIEGTSYANDMIKNMFYNAKDKKTGTLTGSTAICEAIESSPNTLSPSYIFTKTDYRRWESFRYERNGQTSFDVGKGTYSIVTQKVGNYNEMRDNTNSQLKITATAQNYNSDGQYKTNWIVYRLSEIYLMKAEAMSQLYTDEENLTDAFNYCRAVFKRSNPFAYMSTNNTASNDSLRFEVFNSQEGIEALVMTERQREFIGEGKRWFDLVRYAQRRGNTQAMLRLLTRKYSSNRKAVEAKLADIQSLFSPVFNNEIKNNDLLYQNGVWTLNESSSQTDNL